MRDLHGDDVPEDIEARWHAARKDLRMIASGERALLGANGAPVAELGRVLVHQGETTFDAETLEGFLHPSLDSPAGPHRTGRC
ncbi:MAG: hypothetical protein F4X56_00740 [Gammaproteobacteria bacterium]|nr:hypothetical protein [Gammaproteobacteria bacterium]